MMDFIDGATVTLQAQIAEVERELSVRGEVYPRQIEAGRLRADVAERRMLAMRAVRETLRSVLRREGDAP